MHVASVFGSSRVTERDEEYAIARRTGELLAVAGWTVMTGGYHGAMEAASRGAADAGGHVIGVTVADRKDRTAPNRWVGEERCAPNLLARLAELVASDALIAVGGGIGTLAEVALAWNLKQREHARAPLILVGARWERVVPVLARELVIDDDDLRHVHLAGDPEAAMRVVTAL
jgi:uncharacterized protein (TIGR00725 family)